MKSRVPLTKIVLTIGVSLIAVILQTPSALSAVVLFDLLALLACGVLSSHLKTVGALTFFAFLLGGVQFFATGDYPSAAVSALRMLAMTLVFTLLLSTTKLQDLTAALVTQCHVPYTYAFMFTAALRFVPDFLAENRAVVEAQACRGMERDTHVIRRFLQYFHVIQPMVLKSLSRSETMALSLELRGFGGAHRSFVSTVRPQAMDFIIMAGTVLVVALVIGLKYQHVVLY